MPRPSRQIDQVLLASGRALFPASGCAGLSVRAVAEHAGVNPAMFHYHFKSKAVFLDALLQQLYEEMFAALSGEAHSDGPAAQRLQQALRSVARLAREHRRVLARVWMDALSGEPVALDFFRRNAPRHVGLLGTLLDEAEREGAVRAIAPVQRFVFLMGSVLMPIVFAAELVAAAPELRALRDVFDAQVLDDAAIDERIGLAMAALGVPDASATSGLRDAAPARPTRRRAPVAKPAAEPTTTPARPRPPRRRTPA